MKKIIIGIIIGVVCTSVYFYIPKSNDIYEVAFYGRETINMFRITLATGKDAQLNDAERCSTRLNDLVVFKNGYPIAGKVLCGQVLELKRVDY